LAVVGRAVVAAACKATADRVADAAARVTTAACLANALADTVTAVGGAARAASAACLALALHGLLLLLLFTFPPLRLPS
jgi:hypothetical protein